MTLYALALAGSGFALLGSVLAGIWLGFRICTKDAALLARFAAEATEANLAAKALSAEQRLLREEMEATAEAVERKRKSAAAAASKVKQAEEQRAAAVEGDAPMEQLSGRARRRAIGRMLANGRSH